MRLIWELAQPVPAARAVAESRALLTAASAGGAETLRLFRVTSCVAFGPKDERAAGYARALAAARAAGWEPVQRLEGGRAVAMDADALGIAWTIPDRDGRARIRTRFSLLAAVLVEALRALGVDARTGAVPGEYCPGDFSVGARGVVKLAGLGQRVTAGAVQLGACVAVDGAARMRAVLADVYAALAIEWDPRSLGSVSDEAGVPAGTEAVARRVIEAFGRECELRPAGAPPRGRAGAA